jgi:hypothetical protein
MDFRGLNETSESNFYFAGVQFNVYISSNYKYRHVMFTYVFVFAIVSL